MAINTNNPPEEIPEGITRAQAAAELLRRQRARASLVEYSRAINIPGAPDSTFLADPEAEVFTPVETAVADHHVLMLDAIQRTMERPKGRLIILAPPGSAKSSMAVVVGQTWAMGKWPRHRCIVTSYASDIAEKQSKKCRALVRQPEYTSIWPERPILLPEQRAAGEWSLTNGSEMMAAGLLAGITGNRANGIVIDDPVANREDADSAAMREKTYNEYLDTATTRLLPNGYIILIQTRWNEDDLAGRILPADYNGESGMILCQDGQIWEVLCLPAKAEREDDPLGRQIGEYLWPEWFPVDHWSTWENNPRARRTWSALYQQRPSPLQGIQFSRSMFRWYDPDLPPGYCPPGTPGFGIETAIGYVPKPCGPPAALRMYGASDYATKDEAEAGAVPDWTEHGVAGMDWRGNMVFTDWYSGQRETDVTIDAFIKLVQKVRSFPLALGKMIVRWWHEGGPIDKAISPAVNRAMREAKPAGTGFVSREALPSIKSKEIKLLSFHARASANTVYLPLKREWAQKVVEQLVAFPAAKWDDKADVCGLLGRGIDKMADAALPSATERPQGVKPFTPEWLESVEDDDKPKVRYR